MDVVRSTVQYHVENGHMPLDLMDFAYDTVDEVANEIYKQICGFTFNSAHSEPLALDVQPDEWTDLNQPLNTSWGITSTIDMQLLLPLVLALLTVVNLVVLIYVCVRGCFGKKRGYDVVKYDVESDAEQSGMLK